MHLVVFIIRIHHDAQCAECQIGALYVQYICMNYKSGNDVLEEI